jgi:tetratricopeptide (TPR) repeat protein
MRSLGSALAVLLLVAGLAALGYARWTRPIDEGDEALAAGRYDRALASYTVAEARFDRLPATRQLFAADYDRVVASDLLARYRLGRYDEVIDRAEHAPDGTSPHFWSGCAFFQKAVAEEKPDARLGWLGRAEDELHKAVDAAPDDWDTKYDFELTTRLAAELRKQPKTPPKQLMQLLRPPTPSGKPVKRVG